jgi:hypothetical protein
MHTIKSPVSNQETKYLRSQPSPPRSVTRAFLTPSSFNNFFLCCLREILSSTFTAMKFAWLEVAALSASVANANVSPIQIVS